MRFRLKWPESSFLLNLASPWNWIYKADILAKDQQWYEKNVMGTGPFKFVEHVKGSHWVGKKNPDLLGQGQAVPRRLSRDVHQLVGGAGGRDPGRAGPHPVPRLQPRRAGPARPGDRQQDHGPGEPLGLPELRLDAPREEALRRQAGAAGPQPRPRPLRGLAEALQDRPRQGRGGVQVPGHPVRDSARGAREARRLQPRHQRVARRGAPAPEGGRGAGRLLLHLQEPRHPASLRADRHLAHRPVAADRAQRQAWR